MNSPKLSFPLADHLLPPPPPPPPSPPPRPPLTHPGTLSLSAGNVILGKSDSHYLHFLFSSSQLLHWDLLPADTEDDHHSFNTCLRPGGGYITILMLPPPRPPPLGQMSVIKNLTLSSPLPSHICDLIIVWFFFFFCTPPVPSHRLV